MSEFMEYGRVGIVACLYIYHSLVNFSLEKQNIPFLKFETALIKYKHTLRSDTVLKELKKDATKYKIRSLIEDYIYQ